MILSVGAGYFRRMILARSQGPSPSAAPTLAKASRSSKRCWTKKSGSPTTITRPTRCRSRRRRSGLRLAARLAPVVRRV